MAGASTDEKKSTGYLRLFESSNPIGVKDTKDALDESSMSAREQKLRASKHPRRTFGSFHVGKKSFHALNFDYPFASKAFLEEESKSTPKTEVKHYYKRWGAMIVVALLTSITFIILQISISELMALKVKLMASYVGSGNPPQGAIFTAFALWVCVNTILAVASGAIVIYLNLKTLFQDVSEGSGLPEVYAFLNGVDVQGFSSTISAYIRCAATFLMVMANMPGALQEPFIPVGPMLAASIYKWGSTKLRPFGKFQWDFDRRNLAVAGLAASASTVFGTPLGGSIFAIEHLSFWSSETLFILMASATISSMISSFAYFFYRGWKDGYYIPVDIFSAHRVHANAYEFAELPIFVILGVLGGIGGGVWNALLIFLINFRRRFLRNKLLRLAEVVVVALFISFTGLIIYVVSIPTTGCTRETLLEREKSELLNMFPANCNGGFLSMAMFIFQEPRYIIRSLFTFTSNGVSFRDLFLFLILYSIWSIIHAGTFMPSGIILPNIIIGGLWGRMIAVGLNDPSITFLPDSYKSATKLAYLSAVAQASGSTRLSIGLSIIMVEASGSINFLIPVAIVVIISRYLASLINSSIIKVLAYYKGYVLLGHTPIPLCVNLTVEDVMVSEIICLPPRLPASQLVKLLQIYPYLEFPIVDGISGGPVNVPIAGVKGMILRKQLYSMLHPEIQRAKISITDANILNPVVTVSPTIEINLEDEMNPTPIYVYNTASLTRASNIFIALALHTLLVVDENLQLVGVVTRKDLALIRKDYNMWRVKLVTDSTAFK